MKIRPCFVANSSSSSFIVVSLGNEEIFSKGDLDAGESEYASIDIDDLMAKLQEAKAKGIKEIAFEYGGGYDG